MEVNINMYLMANYKYPWLVGMPNFWSLIVQFLKAYTPLIHNNVVRWICPGMEFFKCNTNSSTKVDLNIITIDFYVRDDRWGLVVAQAKNLDVCTALEAEVKAFKKGLFYYLNHNHIFLIMKTDSLIIKKILDRIWEIQRVI